MVIALLLSLSATVGTGLVLYAEEHRAGPLAPFVSAGAPSQKNLPTRAAAADKKKPRAGTRDKSSEGLEDVHEFLANLTLALIIAHVLGVSQAICLGETPCHEDGTASRCRSCICGP